MSLKRDCQVATELLWDFMDMTPTLTPEAAFEQLKLRLVEICIFPWDDMQLKVFPTSRNISFGSE